MFENYSKEFREFTGFREFEEIRKLSALNIWELIGRFRSILSSDLGLNSFESCFFTNLHELFCQFISWTNWVNSGKCMDHCWISCQVRADMKKVYDDIIMINLYYIRAYCPNMYCPLFEYGAWRLTLLYFCLICLLNRPL